MVRVRSSIFCKVPSPFLLSLSLSLALCLSCRVISRNGTRGPYDFSRSVVLRVHTERDRVHVWVGESGLSPIVVRIIRYTHMHERGRRVRALVCATGPPYCPRIGGVRGDGATEGNGIEKGSARREMGAGALSSSFSLSLPPFVPLADRARGTRSFFTFKNHDDAHFSDS